MLRLVICTCKVGWRIVWVTVLPGGKWGYVVGRKQGLYERIVVMSKMVICAELRGVGREDSQAVFGGAHTFGVQDNWEHQEVE